MKGAADVKPISNDKSTKSMTIRVNEKQREAVTKMARLYGLSQAEYLMTLVERDMKEHEENE